jgi:uncharacterized membrane protein YtjA (UPF0391 family)
MEVGTFCRFPKPPLNKTKDICDGPQPAFINALELPRRNEMLGWMIVFAIIAVPGGIISLLGNPAASVRIASFLFSSLFLLGLLTYAVRGRAR